MNKLTWLGEQATCEKQRLEDQNKYILKTTQKLKDDFPKDNKRMVNEKLDELRVETGSPLFDGLFALASEEARENMVESISDWSFESEGQSVFETGKKWHYVWTRDTSYAVKLSLGLIDPQRALNSMMFKISTKRDGSNLQIVQDTGSGGSWPVSSDRVVWAYGAHELAKHLPQPKREEFEKTAFEAIHNTVLMDRETIYDSNDGLYRGEQSFLDWREQTYPTWTAKDTTPIGQSKALSTNACHFYALKYAGELAKKYSTETTTPFEKWANELKESINKEFWDEDSGLYTSMLLDELPGIRQKKYDLLGNSLTVLMDIATESQAIKIIENYPSTASGAPVVHPQLREVPIYHNRAIWPFVTAFYMKAAKKVNNFSAVAAAANTLINSSALNLSNMENYEFITLRPEVEDGELTGPVVNSQRQLWSVGAYLDFVINVLFGIEVNDNDLTYTPFIPKSLIKTFFPDENKLLLLNYPINGKKLNIELLIPKEMPSSDGHYSIDKVVQGENKTTLELKFIASKSKVTTIDSNDLHSLFCPEMPQVKVISSAENNFKVELTQNPEDSTRVFKNGLEYKVVQNCVFKDDSAKKEDQYCFQAIDFMSKNESHISAPITVEHSPIRVSFNSEIITLTANQEHSDDINAIKLNSVLPASKTYTMKLLYRNVGPENTGVTACVKMLEVRSEGEVIDQKMIYMPHREDDEFYLSSPVNFELKCDCDYTLRIKDYMNMSSLKHFEKYTNRGGKSGADNSAEIKELHIY